MTDKEINRVIDEFLGWEKCKRCDDKDCAYNQNKNYCNDLNAMHEAEKVLTEEQRGQIVDELCEIVLREKNTESGPMTAIIAAFFATARQRAEAFLRTLGKWEEAK